MRTARQQCRFPSRASGLTSTAVPKKAAAGKGYATTEIARDRSVQVLRRDRHPGTHVVLPSGGGGSTCTGFSRNLDPEMEIDRKKLKEVTKAWGS
jgi:hypothetical protein